MKKMIIAVLLVVAALAVFTTGIVFAQTPQPLGSGNGFGRGPMGGYGVTGQEGPLHEYMVTAMAEALGISADDFEARRDAGQSAYQIALDLGIPADKIPGLLSDARIKAIDAALADKVISQQQADWMKSRVAGMGQGNCNGTGQPAGPGLGRGRGGAWQQVNP